MKNKIAVIFFFVLKTLCSQNNVPDFEFGHDLDKEFYYEFINDNVSFVDLTQDKFFQKRKELKIKRISGKHMGLSLDSLYQRDTSCFHSTVRTGGFDHGYSYSETLDFDENGFTISKMRYPLSSHLNKKDSVLALQRRTSFSRKSDSLVVSHYYKDTVWSKEVYLKNIVYQIEKEAISKGGYDSLTNRHDFKFEGYQIVVTRYTFTVDNKIYQIKRGARQSPSYDMTFQFPDENNILINCVYRSHELDSIIHLKNKITKNKRGQLLTSTFYHADKPDDFSRFSLIYDKHSNLCEVNRRRKAEGWFDYTEKLYKFQHSYKNGKLHKTTVHFNFRMTYNDIVYLYNEKGLVSEKDIGVYKIYYDYDYN